ncbi:MULTISPECIES: Gp19/Gp15/Gp42 family protein [Bacteria]|jgi:hypothetical protein|uniref:Gp19/Gp15/Gp42 family protein n=1 Tax=Bacteria TaxID=2 RepID=UPI001EDFC99B|nr:Gp19/Gp15/Gp42 family protein [Eggerthella lenta]MCG4515286.1 phage Gp19/Gp15/Gp42 family protein [Eggerthella lenta]BDF40071.1 hypothetical protein CE91St33_01330 [Eggerthella lenta]DAM34078.1 MAG TPA: hypothetical protein [Caudoviricetes sp.]
MDAYASVEDLQARWRPLSSDEEERAEQKLKDASLIVADECRRFGVNLNAADGMTKDALSLTVCEMVKRAMMSPVDRAPITQGGLTVGPFNQSLTYANPTGDLYLTSSEKRRLGIGRQSAGFVHPWGDA